MASKSTNWRQIKFFGMEAHKVLRPGVPFASANLPAIFGIEEVAVSAAHTKAAKAEVASWKNKPEAADTITERVAWWLAFGDQLQLVGIGPHEGERKGRETGISKAIDYSKWLTRNERNFAAGVRGSHNPAEIDGPRGFLTRAGLNPDAFDLPAPVKANRVGGNPMSLAQLEATHAFTAEGAALFNATEVQAESSSSAAGEDELARIAKALKAAGFSLSDIMAELKKAV
jgi:hypothetical protein